MWRNSRIVLSAGVRFGNIFLWENRADREWRLQRLCNAQRATTFESDPVNKFCGQVAEPTRIHFVPPCGPRNIPRPYLIYTYRDFRSPVIRPEPTKFWYSPFHYYRDIVISSVKRGKVREGSDLGSAAQGSKNNLGQRGVWDLERKNRSNAAAERIKGTLKAALCSPCGEKHQGETFPVIWHGKGR